MRKVPNIDKRALATASPEFLKQGLHAHRAGLPWPSFITQESDVAAPALTTRRDRAGSTRCTLWSGTRTHGVRTCLDALF
jgi:hypothetical protein